jgi:hypothetical protein
MRRFSTGDCANQPLVQVASAPIDVVTAASIMTSKTVLVLNCARFASAKYCGPKTSNGDLAGAGLALDVDGSESAVFGGNTGWLAATNVLLIELHDWLYPWPFSSCNFFVAILKHCSEALLLGENLICFKRIAALLTPSMSAAR